METPNTSIWPGSSVPDGLRVFLGEGNTTMLDVDEFDYSYKSEETYTLYGMSYNKCGGDKAEQMVTVTKTPKRKGNMYFNAEEICVGQSLRGSPGAQGAISAQVNYDYGSIDTLSEIFSLEHNYTQNGVYEVIAIFEYLCGDPDTVSRTVTVGIDTDVFNFSINPYRNQFCLGETVQFNHPWLNKGDTLDIDFGDGSSARFFDTIGEVTHMYTNADNYFVKATRSNACGFSKQAQASVNVETDVSSYLTITADYKGEETPLCDGDNIALMMNAGGFTLTNPMFTFEEGSLMQGLNVHTPFNKGEHLIKATAENVCGVKLTSYFTLDVWDHTLNPSLSYYFYPLTQCVNQEFFFDVFANEAKSATSDMMDGTVFEGNVTTPDVYVYRTWRVHRKY
ncbi:MAG: hypothetical protein ACI8SE_001214 [Bacteroidia bacterium]|jgi:hypothetical protein